MKFLSLFALVVLSINSVVFAAGSGGVGPPPLAESVAEIVRDINDSDISTEADSPEHVVTIPKVLFDRLARAGLGLDSNRAEVWPAITGNDTPVAVSAESFKVGTGVLKIGSGFIKVESDGKITVPGRNPSVSTDTHWSSPE